MQPAVPDPIGFESDRPVSAWVRRIAGGVLFCCGFGLLVFLTWATYRVSLLDRKLELVVVIVAGVVAAITVFCLFVGYRLVFNRPNKHGSVLPPFGWYALASVFVLLALGTAAPLVWTGHYSGLTGSVFAAVFAAWCFRAAKRHKQAKSHDPGAL
jgi:hypothetical protein